MAGGLPYGTACVQGDFRSLGFQVLFASRGRDLVATPRLRGMLESMGLGCGQLWAACCRNAASPACPKDAQTLRFADTKKKATCAYHISSWIGRC